MKRAILKIFGAVILTLLLLLAALSFYPKGPGPSEAEALSTYVGDIRVSAGSSLVLESAGYYLRGNIYVGPGATLTIRNSTISVTQDTGNDGTLGTSDDHIYSIVVEGGRLLLYNTTLTTSTHQINPYFALNITVNSSGEMVLESSLLSGPGNITLDGGSLFIRNSTVNDINPPAVDINGDGSTADDVDLNDDSLVLDASDSFILLLNSEFRDSLQFTATLPENLTAANMTLKNSTLVAINSFIDVDFEPLSSSYLHNTIYLDEGSTAYLYNVTFNDTYLTPGVNRPQASAVYTADNFSEAHIYRLVVVTCYDSVSLPLSGVTLRALNPLNGSASPPPRDEVLAALGVSRTTYGRTGGDGRAYLVVRTDTINHTSLPNSHSTTSYRIEGTWGALTSTMWVSFSSYPSLGEQYNIRVVNLTIPGALQDPLTSSVFSGSSVGLRVTGGVVGIRGTSMVKDGKFYPSYYGVSGNIVVSGGELVINDTTLEILSEGGEAFILVSGSGRITLRNSTIQGERGGAVYLYLMNSSGLSATDGSLLKLRYTAMRGSSSLTLNDTTLEGSIDSSGTVTLQATRSTLAGGKIVMRGGTIRTESATVNATALNLNGVAMTVSNTTFAKYPILRGSSTGDIVNCSSREGGSFPLPKDSSSVTVYYFLKVRVSDSAGNPLEGARVDAYMVRGSSQHLYASEICGPGGVGLLRLESERLNSTSRTFTGNYRIEVSYSEGTSSRATSQGTSIQMVSSLEINISLPGAPDLKVERVWFENALVHSNLVVARANITNQGEYTARNFTAYLKVGGDLLDERELTLGPGEWYILSGNFTAEIGPHVVTAFADSNDTVRELNEENNLYKDTVNVSMGPDYMVEYVTSPEEWIKGVMGQLHFVIYNLGDTDPELNPVTFRLYRLDKEGDVLIENLTLDPIPSGGSVDVYLNYTPATTGELFFKGEVSSKFDFNPLNSASEGSIVVISPAELVVEEPSLVITSDNPIGQGDLVTLHFEVKNLGEAEAEDFTVGIYDGEVSEEKRLFTQQVASLKRGESITIYASWTAPQTLGTHTILIVVDPEGTVHEEDTTNNVISFDLIVGTIPDLTISEADVSFSPDLPVANGTTVTIMAAVWNTGGTTAHGVVVRFYMDSSYNLIGESIGDIGPGQYRVFTTTWTAQGFGPHTLFILLDQDNNITESDENNNILSYNFNVVRRPDVTMDPQDISLSIPEPIPYGSTVKVTATVRNVGDLPANDVVVQFFDGDPQHGGKLIEWSQTIPSITVERIEARSYVRVSVNWTALPGGYHTLYVLLDAYNTVKEENEENNIMTRRVYVMTLPDLELKEDSLTFQQGSVVVNSLGLGNTVTINLTVYNAGDTPATGVKVTLTIGDPVHTEDYEVIASFVWTGEVPGRGMANILYNWKPSSRGHYEVFALVEPHGWTEEDPDNNLDSTTFWVYGIEDVPELYARNLTLVYTPVKQLMEEGEGLITGGNYTVEVTVENAGGVAAGNLTVLLLSETSPGERQVVWRWYVEELPGSSNVTLSGFWEAPEEGEVQLIVSVDPENAEKEFNEINNTLQTNLTVIPKPDIFVERWFLPGIFKEDKSAEFRFILRNTGNTTLEGVEVTFLVSPEGGVLEVIGRRTVTLPPNGTRVVTFTWTPSKSGKHTFVLRVDPENRWPESSESNNYWNTQLKAKAAETGGFPLWGWIVVAVILILVGLLLYFLFVVAKKEALPVCANCGEEVPWDAIKCPHCGIEFSTEEIECGQCGAILPADSKVCPNCGAILRPGEMEEEIEEKEEGEEELEELEEREEMEEEEAEEEEEEEELEEEEAEKEEEAPEEEAEEEEMATCFVCGAQVPVTAPYCPYCGAEFE
ncbi:MAG: hypothetical protein DRN55_05485 [Thermoplasmata archaeon]|nr:MAG: hypothetical protein DRN55_05485 [Thermoplasmata archaeon]